MLPHRRNAIDPASPQNPISSKARMTTNAGKPPAEWSRYIVTCDSHSDVRLKYRVSASAAYRGRDIALVYENGSGTVRARVCHVCCPVFKCSQMSVSRISPEKMEKSRITADASISDRSQRGAASDFFGAAAAPRRPLLVRMLKKQS